MFKYKSTKSFYLHFFFCVCVCYIRMEATRQNNDINATKETRKIFNELRNNLSREETKRIRDKLHRKETVCNFLEKKEQEGGLTNKEKKVLKNMDRYQCQY